MDAGKLVPDEVIIGIVEERAGAARLRRTALFWTVCPAPSPQAEALDRARDVHIDQVVSIEIADEVIEERMTGRRVCASLRRQLSYCRATRPRRRASATPAAASWMHPQGRRA